MYTDDYSHQEVHLHQYNPEGCEDCGSTDHTESEALGPCYWKRQELIQVPPGTTCQRHTKEIDTWFGLEHQFNRKPSDKDPCSEDAHHSIPNELDDGNVFVCGSCYQTYKTVTEAHYQVWRSGYKRFGPGIGGYYSGSGMCVQDILKGEVTAEEVAMEHFLNMLICSIQEGHMEETIARVTNPGMVGIAGPRVETTAMPPAKKVDLEPKEPRDPITAKQFNQFLSDYSKMQQANRLRINFEASIERVKSEYPPDSWDPAYPDLWWDKEDVQNYLEWKDFSDSLKSWEEREESCE